MKRKVNQDRDILKPPAWQMLAYLGPSALLFAMIYVIPVLFAIYCGFFDFTNLNNMEFVGTKFYQKLLTDSYFWNAFKHNIIFVVVGLIGQIGIAFLLANLINSRHIRFAGFYRTMSFLPQVLSAVVIGFVWGMIFDYNYGLINVFLRSIGMGDRALDWLGENAYALICVCIPLIWQGIGLYLLIILAAMSSIDKEVYEMAELDGASWFQRMIKITFPLIRGTLVVCTVLCVSNMMRVFDHIYVMTGGGPGQSTTVLAVYAYNVSFKQMKFGYGSAVSVGILVVSLLLIACSNGIVRLLTRGKEV